MRRFLVGLAAVATLANAAPASAGGINWDGAGGRGSKSFSRSVDSHSVYVAAQTKASNPVRLSWSYVCDNKFGNLLGRVGDSGVVTRSYLAQHNTRVAQKRVYFDPAAAGCRVKVTGYTSAGAHIDVFIGVPQ